MLQHCHVKLTFPTWSTTNARGALLHVYLILTVWYVLQATSLIQIRKPPCKHWAQGLSCLASMSHVDRKRVTYRANKSIVPCPSQKKVLLSKRITHITLLKNAIDNVHAAPRGTTINMSQYVTPYHTIPQHITTYHNMSQHVTQQITTYHNKSQQITTYHNISQHLTTCHSMLRAYGSCCWSCGGCGCGGGHRFA